MFMLLKNLSNVALLKGAHKHNSTNSEMPFSWDLFFPIISNFDLSSNGFELMRLK